MKAALALIFFACIAGSMAADARANLMQDMLAQGQVVASAIIAQLQQTVMTHIQQALGQLTSLVGSIGGRFNFDTIMASLGPMVQHLGTQLLGHVLGGLSGLIGGRASFDFAGLFGDFFSGIQTQITEIGQTLLNSGLAAVLGGLGSLGGSRGFGDIFASLSQSVSAAVTAAQGALSGALGGLSALGGQLLDASKPHWEQLQEQLVGHGLNVLGSLSETINNIHGTVTGGR